MPKVTRFALLSVVAAAAATLSAQSGAPVSNARLTLTVDSIMRGPDLVGYPPDMLRWSVDSSRLYFDWRKPGEEEASTYVVGRDGGTPVRLTDDEKKKAPPAGGRWDKARKRVLFADRGDIVVLDASGTRRSITRTTAAESNPRWAKHDTAVTYVRDGNLFLIPIDVPLDGEPGAGLQQLTDNAPKKTDPRLTDSQKFVRDEEEKLLDSVREAKDKKKKADEKDKQDKLPGLELADRQTATDLMLSPDGTHVFAIVSERPAGARTVIVPNWVNETGYVEDIPGRTAVGDSQNRLLLAVVNLKTGKSVWADAGFAPAANDAGPVPSERSESREPVPSERSESREKKTDREIRWSMPDVSDDGRYAVAGARSADNKDRGTAVDSDTGKTRIVDTLHDEAWIREAGAGFDRRRRFLPTAGASGSCRSATAGCILHADVSDPSRSKAADVRQVESPPRRSRAAGEVLSHERGSARSSSTSAPCRSTAARAPRSRR